MLPCVGVAGRVRLELRRNWARPDGFTFSTLTWCIFGNGWVAQFHEMHDPCLIRYF